MSLSVSILRALSISIHPRRRIEMLNEKAVFFATVVGVVLLVEYVITNGTMYRTAELWQSVGFRP